MREFINLQSAFVLDDVEKCAVIDHCPNNFPAVGQ